MAKSKLMESLVDMVVNKHYVVTTDDIENMARSYASAVDTVLSINGTYLRCLLAGCQADLGPTPRGRRPQGAQDQLTVLDRIHDTYYEAVLRGIDHEAMTPLERNRKSNYARTAKYALRRYVEVGGDLRALKPEEVTKGMLQEYLLTHTTTVQEQRVRQDRATRAAARIEGELKEIAELAGLDVAKALLAEILERLEGFESTLAGLMIEPLHGAA